MFLLERALEQKKAIKYTNDRGNILYTVPNNSFKNFLNQRIRWGSKTNRLNILSTKLLGTGIMVSNLIFLINILMLLLNYNVFLVIPLFIKVLSDIIFIRKAANFFEDKSILTFALPVGFIYPFVILFTGVISIIVGIYRSIIPKP